MRLSTVLYYIPYHELGGVSINLVIFLCVMAMAANKQSLAAFGDDFVIALIVPAAKNLPLGVLTRMSIVS